MSKVNWKERYQALAKLTEQLLQHVQAFDFLQRRIANEIQYNDRLDLSERGVERYMRLKQEVVIKCEYHQQVNNYKTKDLTFPAGTLIKCDKSGWVYLDENRDGDGFLHFPPDLLEPVEIALDDPTIDWNKIVQQG